MPANQHTHRGGFSLWWVLPWLAAGLASLFYLLVRRRTSNDAIIQPVQIDLTFVRSPTPPPQPAPAAPERETPTQPDDLTVINGIGPKISALLRENGITTFAQLAETDPQRLQKMLEGTRARMADPASWPEQARLAADRNWDAMKALAARSRANHAG